MTRAKERADKLLSNLGYCSRSEARKFIKDHVFSAAGVRVQNVALKVDPATATVDDEPLDNPDGLLLLLNKPCGLVCSHDVREGSNVYNLLPERWRLRKPSITSVGRLDKDTSGVLLLTDQSQLVHVLTSPKHKVSKVYTVTLEASVPEMQQADMVKQFASGNLMLKGEDRPCQPAELIWTGHTTANVTLTEGRYHQVRRMFAACGCHVQALHRTKFGHLALDGIPQGRYKQLPLDTFA